MSEEKKLTDEEIIKAAEYCQKIGDYSRENCKGCSYYKKSCTDLPKDILYLIHRLQSRNALLESDHSSLLREVDGYTQTIAEQKAEIERLKDVNAGLALANLCDLPPNEDCLTDNEFEIARKTIAEQKAEIERLKDVNAGLALANLCDLPPNEDCLTDNEFEIARKTIAEQKAEIERLTGVVNRLEMADKCGRRMRTVDQKEIAELQKQVDEYKAKIEQGTLVKLPCILKPYYLCGEWHCKIMKGFDKHSVPLMEYFHDTKKEKAVGKAEKRLKELQNG